MSRSPQINSRANEFLACVLSLGVMNAQEHLVGQWDLTV